MRWFFKKIICWAYPELKWLNNPSYDFTKLRSWQSNVKKEENVHIESVHVVSDTTIGKHAYIAFNAMISKSIIGRYTNIGPNCFCGYGIHPTDGLSISPMFYSTRKQNGFTFSSIDKVAERKPIYIGNDVYIGANVTILDGVTIGDGAIIGAGAVVSKDIPPYAVAYGVPIQIVRYRYSKEQIAALLRIQWWNFDDDKLRDVEKYFFDVDKFIKKYDTQK